MTQSQNQVLVAIGLFLSAISTLLSGCFLSGHDVQEPHEEHEVQGAQEEHEEHEEHGEHGEHGEQIPAVNLEGTWVSQECRETRNPGEYQSERVRFEINRFTYTQEVHALADCSDESVRARVITGVYVLLGDSSTVSGAKNVDFSVLDTTPAAGEGPQPGDIYYSMLKVDGDLLYFGDDHGRMDDCHSPEGRPTTLGNSPFRRQ